LTKNYKNNNSSTGKSGYKDLTLDGMSYALIEYNDLIVEKNKRLRIKGFGEKFASINSFFLEYLKEYHIPSAYLQKQGNNVLKFINHQRYPFYIKMLNACDARISKIFMKKEFDILPLPVLEFHYGEGKDSLISESYLIAFNLCTYEDLKLITRICSKVNAVLKSFFERRNEILAEVSCHFGKAENKVLLIEDFTPKSIKIIPLERNEKSINPYKLTTLALYRKYTEHLFNQLSS
jgi:phosphoribosylaminoimidazole-succinocarboxamide synthase